MIEMKNSISYCNQEIDLGEMQTALSSQIPIWNNLFYLIKIRIIIKNRNNSKKKIMKLTNMLDNKKKIEN